MPSASSIRHKPSSWDCASIGNVKQRHRKDTHDGLDDLEVGTIDTTQVHVLLVLAHVSIENRGLWCGHTAILLFHLNFDEVLRARLSPA